MRKNPQLEFHKTVGVARGGTTGAPRLTQLTGLCRPEQVCSLNRRKVKCNLLSSQAEAVWSSPKVVVLSSRSG